MAKRKIDFYPDVPGEDDVPFGKGRRYTKKSDYPPPNGEIEAAEEEDDFSGFVDPSGGLLGRPIMEVFNDAISKKKQQNAK